MSMCRVFSCVVGRGCLLWSVCSLGKTLLACFALYSKAKLACYSRYLLTSYFCILVHYDEKGPLQCSCLENPRDGGAWWVAIFGVAQSRTRLKWLSSWSSRVRKSCLLVCLGLAMWPWTSHLTSLSFSLLIPIKKTLSTFQNEAQMR